MVRTRGARCREIVTQDHLIRACLTCKRFVAGITSKTYDIGTAFAGELKCKEPHAACGGSNQHAPVQEKSTFLKRMERSESCNGESSRLSKRHVVRNFGQPSRRGRNLLGPRACVKHAHDPAPDLWPCPISSLLDYGSDQILSCPFSIREKRGSHCLSSVQRNGFYLNDCFRWANLGRFNLFEGKSSCRRTVNNYCTY